MKAKRKKLTTRDRFEAYASRNNLDCWRSPLVPGNYHSPATRIAYRAFKAAWRSRGLADAEARRTA